MRKICCILLGILLSCVGHDVSATGIDVRTSDGWTISVVAMTPQIVKVTTSQTGDYSAHEPQSVLPVRHMLRTGMIDDQGNLYLGYFGDMEVEYNKKSGRIDFYSLTGDNRRLIVTDRCLRTIDGKNGVELDLVGQGSFYGAGERGHRLNLRGDTLVMYNRQNYGYTGSDPRIDQMNITMPLFLSTDGYAIVFDDYAAAELILSDPVKYITENTKPITYYIVVSKDGSLASLTESLTYLTGRQELPPFWALGYITSKYGYKTQAETLQTVDTLKALGYPLDGIVLDLYWYGKEQDMGRLEWDKEQWPDAEGMLSELKDKGVNLVAISQPYVLRNGRGLENYNDLSAKGMFVADSTGTGAQEVKIWVGEGGMFDVSNPATREWLSNRYDTLTRMGIGGWWGDLGEPEVHPETGRHANGLTARQYHNKYGNDWSQIIYDLFKEKYPDTRLMTMMRGGTIGLQRYDVFPWSTDVSRSWGGLEPQITIMTQSGLSGLGYMGHDVGGFAVDPDKAYMPELYLRWLQLGTFSPILRTHAQEYAEPFHYPQYNDQILALIKERYRWLPYNYTLAYENATKGYPMVRPLEFHSTTPTGKYDDIRDEYLWGRDVLIAPVMTEGDTTRTVVLPGDKTTWWFDMNDINHPGYDGGDTITVAAPLGVLPMFARGGAFIPTADYEFPNNTGDYNADRYTINYYGALDGVESSYTLFEDDRTTPSAKSDNKGLLIHMTGVNRYDNTEIIFSSEGSYDGMTETKEITMIAHIPTTLIDKVTVNGKKINFEYVTPGYLNGVIKFKFKYKVGTTTTIIITYALLD